jgi:hypothetical protein
LPATYAALLVQGALGFASASTENLGLDAGLLVLSTVVGLIVAGSLYRWRES